MNHIVLTATDNFIAYAAVLMTSIVDHIDSSLSDGDGFTFHIITEQVSENNKKNLQLLALELSKKIPTGIVIHELSGEDFDDLPNHGSNIIYLRLKISSTLSEDISRCLFLDVDMLVRTDLRSLFSLDLIGKLGAAVPDMGGKSHKLRAKESGLKDIPLGLHYFNAGFMLLNLDQWRKEKIEEKCLALLRQYKANSADQDVLNAVMPIEHRIELPFAWNFFTNAFCYVICSDEETAHLPFLRKDFEESRKHPYILHYAMKPWSIYHNFLDADGKDIGEEWWNTAEKTPIFSAELLALKQKLLQEQNLQIALGYEAWKRSQSFLGLLSLPFLALNKSKDDVYKTKAETMPRNLFAISCRMGETMTHARQHPGKALNVIMKIRNFRLNYLRYGVHRAD